MGEWKPLTERRTEKAKEIRRQYQATGKDYCPRREKEIVIRTDGYIGALTSGHSIEQLIVSPRVSKTIRCGGLKSPVGSKQEWDAYFINGDVKRLSPTHCERLQGFPDGWTEGISDTQRYKCLGNAVTVNVIREIAKRFSKDN